MEKIKLTEPISVKPKKAKKKKKKRRSSYSTWCKINGETPKPLVTLVSKSCQPISKARPSHVSKPPKPPKKQGGDWVWVEGYRRRRSWIGSHIRDGSRVDSHWRNESWVYGYWKFTTYW